MKVMVIVKATDSSEAGVPPTQELMNAMGEFNEMLVKAGIMESGDGLKPSNQGFRVRFSGNKREVVQGPFIETNELIAGYWIWNVDSIEQAIEWVKKCPNPMLEDSDIEIRPFYSMEDYADWDTTGEIAEKEQCLRDTVTMQNSMQQATMNSYLFFSGRCEEALNYYQEHLGASISMLMRFSDSPEPLPEDALTPGFEDKVMHCEFNIANIKLFASDGCGDGTEISGFSLALTLNDPDEAHRVFNALAKNGQINMPLTETFWSPLYGQVTDQFGVAWMVMLPGEAPDTADN